MNGTALLLLPIFVGTRVMDCLLVILDKKLKQVRHRYHCTLNLPHHVLEILYFILARNAIRVVTLHVTLLPERVIISAGLQKLFSDPNRLCYLHVLDIEVVDSKFRCCTMFEWVKTVVAHIASDSSTDRYLSFLSLRYSCSHSIEAPGIDKPRVILWIYCRKQGDKAGVKAGMMPGKIYLAKR